MSVEEALPRLLELFEQAAKCDSWGQRLEASELYEKFHHDGSLTSLDSLDPDAQKAIRNVVYHAKRRAQALQATVIGRQFEDVNHQQIGADIQVLKEILMKLRQRKLRRKSSAMVAKVCEEGGLLPPLTRTNPDSTRIVVQLGKIGLKNALVFIDPFITVSLRDVYGRNVTVEQNTPPSELYEEKYIVFKDTVHVQQFLENIVPGQAIMFELKHYKPRKGKISTKCFTFMELDEIKPGPLALELYQKPVDYTRKKLYLLTEKQLYLHIVISFNKA